MNEAQHRVWTRATRAKIRIRELLEQASIALDQSQTPAIYDLNQVRVQALQDALGSFDA